MRIVDEAIEDGVGIGWVADDLVPFIDRDLAGQNGRTAAISFFEDLVEITASATVERFEAPIIEDEELDTRAKPKERTLIGPAEAPANRARSSRNGGRNHLGMPGDIKSEGWATSSRIRGRLPPESARDRVRNTAAVTGAPVPMLEAPIAQAVQLLDLMLEHFADDGRWTRGRYEDGNGGRCLVGALLHLSRKHGLPRAPAIALLQDAMPRPGLPLVHFNDAAAAALPNCAP